MSCIAQALNIQIHGQNYHNGTNQKSIREVELYIHPLGQKKDTPIGVSSFLSNPQ